MSYRGAYRQKLLRDVLGPANVSPPTVRAGVVDFPDWVADPSPCRTRARSYLRAGRHGAERVIVAEVHGLRGWRTMAPSGPR